MLTELMRHYDLAFPPIDAGFFETEHDAQVSRDIHAAIIGGHLTALTRTAVIGSGKTILSRPRRANLEREGRVIVSRSLAIVLVGHPQAQERCSGGECNCHQPRSVLDRNGYQVVLVS